MCDDKKEKDMTPEELLAILQRSHKLKENTRHCWIEPDRKESVADHSWRVALMAMLLSGVSEFRDYDMNKVIRMCLIHDLGEAFTGDIPTFEKTDEHRETEKDVYGDWVHTFPVAQKNEWCDLLDEMEALETPEAKLYKALDKLEAVITHDETDISTWLPREYELQLTYTKSAVAFSPYLKDLDAAVDQMTRNKILRESR